MTEPALPPQTVPEPAAVRPRDMMWGVLALMGGASLLGLAPILVKLSDLGPQAIAFWRLALAVPVLALWLAMERRGASGPPGRPDRGLLILAGLFFAGDLAFWHAGIKITTAANAAFLPNLTLVLVPLFAWILFRESVGPRFILAAGIALCGALLLSGANLVIAPERIAGDALSAITAVWYAAYILAIRAARRGASTARVMLWSTAVAAPVALAVTLGFGEAVFPATLAGWLPLIALGCLVHAGGQGGVAFGLGRVPAGLAALIILIQPVIASALGWAVFGEALAPLQWLGAGMVLAAIYIAQSRPRRTVRP
jgi:drug/metabolite transporter (DMT)-like permease